MPDLQSIFEFFLAQLLEGLRPPPTASRPLQPSKRTNAQDSQSQSQSQSGTASQRIADAPYYTEYCLLLESLATIKSIVLACDVPKGDDLMVGYFAGFVQIVRCVTAIRTSAADVKERHEQKRHSSHGRYSRCSSRRVELGGAVRRFGLYR